MQENTDSLKSLLKAKASELGFDDLRIAKAEVVADLNSNALKVWLENSYNDEMRYLERNFDKRINPKILFPEAESVLVFSAGFYRKSKERRIALFAQGADYHDVLKDKLKILDEILKSKGFVQKICVDTAPILEKYFAAKAGLGWIGKNTLLITQKNGPFQFLGLILSSAKFEADSESKDHCGTCTKCLESCPTKALAPYLLNAKLCISNLTIERKNALTKEEEILCQDKIFGCDECLFACPFGAKASPAKIEEFKTTLELSENSTKEDALKFIASKRAQSRLRGLK